MPATIITNIGTQQPIALPIFLWRPDLVSGTPILRDSFPFAADNPLARFHENEAPYFLPFRATSFSLQNHIKLNFRYAMGKKSAYFERPPGHDFAADCDYIANLREVKPLFIWVFRRISAAQNQGACR